MKNRIVPIVFSLFLGVLIALCSKVTLGREPDHSVLRLSWVHVGEKVSKTLSPEELEALPIHMRPQDGVLESVAIPYLLEVWLDGSVISKEIIDAAGLQGDRPMVVFKDFTVVPGSHDLRILFAPDHKVENAISYEVDQSIDFATGRVVTVRLIRDQARLEIR